MRKKILIPMAVVAIVCAAVIGILGVIVVKIFVGGFNDEQMTSAHVVATTIIEDYKNNAKRASLTAAQNEQLVNALKHCLAGNGNRYLIEVSESLMESAGVDLFAVTDANGIVLARGHEPANYGDTLAYQGNVKNALQGKAYATIVEGPIVKLSALCGAPIFDQAKQVIGTLSLGYRLDQNSFADHIKHLTNTEVSVFAADTRVSTTVVDENGERAVGTKASPEVAKQVLNGDYYSGRTTVIGKSLLSGYSPLRDSEGSILGMISVGLDTTAMDAHMAQDTLIMIGVVLLLGALSVLVSWNIASRISRPIVGISEGAKQLSTGDIDIDLDIPANLNADDEVGALKKEFEGMLKTINQQAEVLSTIADGDYSVAIPIRSEQDIINRAINRLIDSNNEVLSEINASASQVSSASKQIAFGSQSLAQGSTEQAATIAELSVFVSEFAEKTKQNAEIAREAAVLSGVIRSKAEKGSDQMDQMMQAVEEISDASNNIEKVIKVIDDIAFQTNILSLNAAVEAARAGPHGKGFAVVAEEVRNLAAKSAEAAKDTGSLIERSIAKANFGLNIANETLASLKEIVKGINRSAEIVTQIASSSDKQVSGIAQINSGIDQVVEVVQKNSATAEESAAASEEMSRQSEFLARLTAQFKLRDDRNSNDERQSIKSTVSKATFPSYGKKVYSLSDGSGSRKNKSKFIASEPDIYLPESS